MDNALCTDRGFSYGEGFFETMLWQNQKFSLLEFHKERLMNACQKFNFELSENNLIHSLELAKKHCFAKGKKFCARVKLTVTLPENNFGSYPETTFFDQAKQKEPNIYTRISPYESANDLDVQLVLAPKSIEESSALVGLKHLSRFNYIAALADLKLKKHQQAFFLDSEGYLVDAMHHNLFFIKNEKLYTPKLKSAGVEGVYKRFLIEKCVGEAGIELLEIPLKLDDLFSMQEAFITNALSGISSVSQIVDNHFHKINIQFTECSTTKALKSLAESYLSK